MIPAPPGGVAKGLSPGPGTGYCFTALVTEATAKTVSSQRQADPQRGGQQVPPSAEGAPRQGVAGDADTAPSAMDGKSRPTRSLTPSTPEAT